MIEFNRIQSSLSLKKNFIWIIYEEFEDIRKILFEMLSLLKICLFGKLK